VIEFIPNSIHTARASITVKPAGLACSAELYLGAKIATSGMRAFASTGSRQDITLPITMPGIEGSYPVYLDILTEGMLIGAYQAIEDVVIIAPELKVTVRLKNPPTTPVLGESLAWYLTIWNHAKTESRILMGIPIAEAITFENVPQDWFPLPVFILVYWLPERIQIGTYQSWDPSFGGYMGNVFIPSPGSYYFNCATRKFEKV